MHSVNLECEQELGLSVYDLYDLDYRAHYEALSIQPTWAEWDSAVQYCVEDIKAENGMDW